MLFLCVIFNLLQLFFSSSNFCDCLGVWADPFVPTAILGETQFFLLPLLLSIYSYLYAKENDRALHL